MNKIYKVIWNKTLNCWNVTSELGKAHGKVASQVEQSAVESNPLSHFFFRLKVSAFAVLAALLPVTSYAAVSISDNVYNPPGGERAFNYYNPGNLSYNNPNSVGTGNLYSPSYASAELITIGSNADARTLGYTAYTAAGGIAIGDYSRAVGGLGIALGQYSQSTDIGATAIGTGALASGFNALSMMRQSAATDDYAMAIGNVSYAKGKGSLAMGQSSTALGNQSIAIGSADVSPKDGEGTTAKVTQYDGTTNTQASADFAVAIGAQSKALKESAVALGTKAKANGLNSTAIGTESSANEKSAALGYQAKADGKEATAIGVTSSAAGEKSLALGMNANASKNGAFAIGADSAVSAENAGAIGQNTKVAQQNTIAIGNNITSTQANSLVLGTGSTDRAATTEQNITINDNTYTYAGQSAVANGVVSVASVGKERQIINVGAGKVSGDSTDAINGSQLYAVTEELTHFYSVNSKDTAAGNYNNKGATGVNALAAGVGASATQKDAVAVGGNAKGLGELSVAVGSAQAQSSHAVAIGSAASTGSAADSAIAMGHLANADKNYTVAIGSSAKALQDSSVAIGSSAGARGNQALALGASAAAEATTATSVGANTFAKGTSATAISANAKANTIGDIALGANASATGRSTSNATITANNATREVLGSAIAVGSIAKAEGRNALAIGNNAQALGTTTDGSINDMIAIGANSSVSANRGTALGYKAIVATGADNSVAIGYNTKSYSNNAVAIGSGAIVGSTTGSNTSGISIGAGAGSNYISGTESVAIGNQSGQYVDGNTNYALGSRAGNTVKGADNYAQGIEAGQVVSGLGNTAIGYASGRYVNGDHNQSYGYGDKNNGQNINGNDNISLGTLSGRNIGEMTSGVTAGKATFTSTTKSNRNIAIGYESNKFDTNAPLLTSDNLAMGTRTIASGGSAMALGAGAQATGANSLALGVSTVANTANNEAGAVSNNTKASGENAIAIGHGAQASAKDTISIGTGNVVSGQGSSAVGDPSIVAGSNSFSAGNNNVIGNSTDNAFIFGGRNNLGGTAATRDTNGVISTAGGISNAVNASKSAIVGYNNSVQDQNVFVVGNNVEVAQGMAGAVVLGNDSTADAYVQATKATIGDVEFGTFAGYGTLTPGAIVSVGKSGAERQIKNVAAGQISNTSTDAINGSQLYAVANKPMTFAGDSGTNVERKLGETLTIKGGKTDGLTENNIGVVADKDKNTLTVKLAETINLGEKGSVQTGNTKIDNGGLTITNGPSVTNTGINAGGTTITNVAKGDKDADAVNKEQLDAVEEIAKSKLADFTVLANSEKVKTVNKDDNSIAFIDGTNIKVTNDNGKVKIATADDVTFNTVTVNNSGDVKQGDNNAVTGDTVFKALDGLSKTVVAAGNNVTVSDPQTSDDGKTTTYTVNAEKTTVSAKTDGGLTVNAGDKGANDVTNYEVALSKASQDSLKNADTALQSWTAQVNGTDAKEVKSGNNKVNFVDGDNITITNDATGNIKVSTTKAATFDTVTINNGGSVTEGSKSAVNGGDVYTAIQNTESQFTGDNNTVTVKRKPSQVLSITGGATGDATRGNIKTVADANGSIAIQLAKQLTGLSSISAESIKLGDKVEISKDGINAGGTTISKVASGGTTESNAANIGDVQKAAAAAKTEMKAGTNVTDVAKTKGEDDHAIYTVNANGSSVSAESALTVTKGDKDTNNVTDYKVDLAQTTKNDIKTGVDAAKDIAEKGLTFTADGKEKSGIKKLGDEVAITGDKNITTIANDNGVQVTLSSNLTGLDSITTNGGVTINNGGINAGDKKITNVSDGTKPTDAVNKGQLDTATAAAKTEVKAGTNVTDIVKTEGSDGQAIYTVNANGSSVSAESTLKVTAGEKDDKNVTDYNIDLADKTKEDIAKGVEAAKDIAEKGLTFTSDNGTTGMKKLGESVAVTGDQNITTTASNGGVAIALNSDLKGLDSIITNGGVVINGDGINAGGKQITNVASAGDITSNANKNNAVNAGDLNTAINNVNNTIGDVKTIADGKLSEFTVLANTEQVKTVNNENKQIAFIDGENIRVTNAAGSVKIATAKDVTFDSVKINNSGNVTKGDTSAVTGDVVNTAINNVVNGLGKTVVAAGNNVTVNDPTVSADGKTTTYTVNAEKTTVTAKTGGGLEATPSPKSTDAVTNYEIELAETTIADIQAGKDAKTEVDKGFKVQADADTTADKKLGDTVAVKGDGSNISTELKDGNIVVKLADAINLGGNGSIKAGDVNINKDGINAGDKQITNVAAGSKGTDAVNVAQLKQVQTQYTGDNGDVTVKRKASEVLSITGGATTGTENNIQTVANENGSIAIKLAKDISLGTDGSVKTGNTTVNNDGIKIEGDNPVSLAKNGLNNGGNAITNVAAGTSETDAVNKGQLDDLATQIAQGAKSAVVADGKNTKVTASVDGNVTTYTVDAEKTTVSAATGSGLSAVGTKNAETDVTDYAIGLSQGTKDSLAKADTALQSWTAQVNGTEVKVVDKDNNSLNFANGDNIEITAENGAIKVATAKEVTFDKVTINNGGDVAENSTSAVNGGDVYTAIQNSQAQFKADNDTVISRKPSDVLSITGGATGETTSGNIKTVGNADGSIAIQLAKNLTDLANIATDSIKAGDTVEITKDGINAGNTIISNVKDGANPTDAVNKQQLDNATAASKTEVKAGTNVADVTTATGEKGQTVYTMNAEGAKVSAGSEMVSVTAANKDANHVTDYSIDLAQSTKDEIKQGTDAAQAIADKGLTFTSDNAGESTVKKLGDKVAITGDKNITTVANDNGVQVTLNSNLTGLDSITTNGGVKINDQGINAGDKVIGNVAAGVDGKDAVNKEQLDALRTEIAAGEKSEVVEAGKNTSVDKNVEGNVTTYTVSAEKTTVSAGTNGVKVVAGGKDADGTTNYEINLDKDLVAGNDTEAGTITVKGEDGKDGVSLNGKDGTIGLNGADGANATVGVAKDGKRGVDGTGAKPRLTVNDEQVATLNDGLKFVGDNRDVTVTRKLNETLAINGGATGETTAGNIKTIGNTDGSITIQLAKDLTDLTSATFGDTLINNDGVTITNGDNPVSLSKNGLDNGSNTITNVAAGEKGTDAVNKQQLDNASAAAKTEVAKGTNIAGVSEAKGDNGQTVYTVNADGTSVSNASGDIVVTKGEKGDDNVTDYKIDLAQSVKEGIKKGADAAADIAEKGLTFNADNNSSTGVKKLGDELAFNGDENMTTVATENGIQVSLNKTLTGLQSVTIGDVVINEQGINAGDKQIQNVASAGDIANAANAKNAVNAGDLNDAINNVNNAIQNSAQQFKGDNETVVSRKPNEVLTLKGGATGETAENNIKTVGSDDGSIAIELAKDVNLSKNGSVRVGDTAVNNDGISIKSPIGENPDNTVSLGKDGLNNGGNKISNLADGVDGKDAVNKDQLDAAVQNVVNNTKTSSVKAGNNTTVSSEVNPDDANDTVYTVNAEKTTVSAGNSITVEKGETDANGVTDYQIGLSKDLTIGEKGADGKDGEDGSLAVNGKDGNAVVLNGKDGSIGLTGAPGVDGKSPTTDIKVANGAAGVNGKDGETSTRITYTNGDTLETVASLNDGLKFQGDTGEVIAKKLNDTLAIKGNAEKDAEVTDKNIRVDNEDGNLIVKMAKELNDLTSATFGNTVINNGGVTIKDAANPEKTVGLTNDGLNNGGNQIKNVASGLGDTALADATGDTLTNAANIGDVQNAAAAARTEVKAGTNVASVVAEAGDKGQTVYTVNANGSSVTAGSELISVNAEKDAASNITDYKIDLSDKAKQSITAAKTEVKAADGESNLTVTPKTGANGQAIYEVALSKDLAVDSLQAGATKIDGNGLTVGDVAVTADGIRAGDNKITDVAAGTVSADSRDAVNGGQLFNQGEGVKNIIGGNTVYNSETGSYTNNNIGGTGKDNIDDAIKAANDKATQAGKGWNLSVNNGVNKGNIAPDASVDLNNSDNNIVISKNGNNVTFDLNKDLAVSNLTADNSIKVGDVVVTKDGINAGNTVISNVQAAEVKQGGSDAATTGQLYNNSKSVADALGGGATVDASGNINAPSYTITQTDGTTVTANSVGGALSYFNREVVKPITFAADQGSHEAKLGITVNVKGDGKNISTAMNGNSLTISMTDTPEFNMVTTGNTVMSSNGISVSGGNNGVVSLTANGLDNGGNRITNVAPGVEGTDAVNVNQLNAVSGNLNKRIDSVDKHARGGIAGALATAGLYQAYLPGHSMVAVGAGTYRGENALAIGVSRISDNGKIGVKLSGMSTSQGDVGGSVSVGYQW